MPNNPPRATYNKPKRYKYKENRDDIIFSSSWKKLRAQHLEAYPICQRCIYLNKVSNESTINLSVHHIYQRTKYPELALDDKYLLTLCNYCHHKYFDPMESTEPEKAIEIGLKIRQHVEKSDKG